MATYTSYLNLEKPATSETFNLSKINSNWDKIDAGCSAVNTKITSFIYGGTIPNNTDLNDVTNAGFYQLSGASTYSNKPASDCYGMLVLKAGANASTIIQVGFGTANMYYRINSGTRTWYKVTASAL